MDYFDPIAIANGGGEIQERYTYTAFGLASILTPSFTARSATSFAWNFFFHGQFRDTETAWDNYGFRYYLPWLGRWTDRDPLEEEGDENLYAMVLNDPINWVDFLGLAPGGTCCRKDEEKDDYGTCCKKGMARPDPANPLKKKCQEKKEEDKDKKKGFLSRLFKRCKPKVKIETQETYKGSEIKVKPLFTLFKKGRVSGYAGAEFKAVGDRVNWPPQCVVGIEIRGKN
jgi:RHS repeat-associated protein